MRALHGIQRTTSAAGALAIAGTVLAGACSPSELAEARVQSLPTGAPMTVSCEPTQRAVVRQVVINGVAMSQVECTTTGAVTAPVAVGYQPGIASAVPVSYTTSAPALDDARVVHTSTTRVAPRPVTYVRSSERVVYRPKRSVAKSALIIGSSAGAGAGLGALIGGKKGALIGAAAAGGGATLWDQLTRRQQ